MEQRTLRRKRESVARWGTVYEEKESHNGVEMYMGGGKETMEMRG